MKIQTDCWKHTILTITKNKNSGLEIAKCDPADKKVGYP